MTNNLLIATVGGSPEPVIASLLNWKPKKIIFIVSKDSEASVTAIIERVNSNESNFTIELHDKEHLMVEDPQNMEKCLENLVGLETKSADWNNTGEDYETIIDFTGGTKCMSASLVLFAQNWNCNFSYVGGLERSKDSIGVVLDGKEQIIHNPNPWIYLGYQELEKIGSLFNAGYFQSASSLLSDSIVKSHRKHRKNQLVSLRYLCNALGAWDAFDHKLANEEFKNFFDRQNDFISIYDTNRWKELQPKLQKIYDWTNSFSKNEISRPLLSDLYMNGNRRQKESRFIDAVGRYYRCTEALAQYVLSERFNIKNTGKVDINLIPPEMALTPDEDGFVKLALQESYKFLLLKNDRLGTVFKELKMAGRESILDIRNRCFLAHGFEIIRKETSEDFQSKLLKLLQSENIDPEKVIPTIPNLIFNENHHAIAQRF